MAHMLSQRHSVLVLYINDDGTITSEIMGRSLQLSELFLEFNVQESPKVKAGVTFDLCIDSDKECAELLKSLPGFQVVVQDRLKEREENEARTRFQNARTQMEEAAKLLVDLLKPRIEQACTEGKFAYAKSLCTEFASTKHYDVFIEYIEMLEKLERR